MSLLGSTGVSPAWAQTLIGSFNPPTPQPANLDKLCHDNKIEEFKAFPNHHGLQLRIRSIDPGKEGPGEYRLYYSLWDESCYYSDWSDDSYVSIPGEKFDPFGRAVHLQDLYLYRESINTALIDNGWTRPEKIVFRAVLMKKSWPQDKLVARLSIPWIEFMNRLNALHRSAWITMSNPANGAKVEFLARDVPDYPGRPVELLPEYP